MLSIPVTVFMLPFANFFFFNCLQIFLWKRTHACVYTRRAGETLLPTFGKESKRVSSSCLMPFWWDGQVTRTGSVVPGWGTALRARHALPSSSPPDPVLSLPGPSGLTDEDLRPREWPRDAGCPGPGRSGSWIHRFKHQDVQPVCANTSTALENGLESPQAVRTFIPKLEPKTVYLQENTAQVYTYEQNFCKIGYFFLRKHMSSEIISEK